MKYGKSLRVRFRADQEAKLAAESVATGVKVPEIVRRLIDEHYGDIRRVEQLRPPSEPVKPLVRQVCPPAGKNDHVVHEDDRKSGMTPPPTGWAGRKAQVRAGVRGSARGCGCPPGTQLDGQVCTGCLLVR